jgi:hypothetical protein
MDKNDITEEYKSFLNNLNKVDFETLFNEFKKLKENKTISYKEKELYLNKVSCDQLNNILFNDDFIKLFYLDNQARYILNLLSGDLNTLKTLVYCYNTNSREFNDKVKEQKLKDELLKDGFKEQKPFSLNKEENILIREELKKLNGLKVNCVFDRDKIGLLGSFQETEKHEGKLIFIESETKFNKICFMPKRHTKTGQILSNRFYYKLI